jgi:hypothetical protein
MKATLTCLLFASLFCCIQAKGQSLSLQKMIDATRCKNDTCFTSFIQPDSMCFDRTFSNATGTFFRYKNCESSTSPENRLIVHFAVLNDKHFNSSFLTWSEEFSEKLKHELDFLDFKKIENPEDPNRDRTWLHSSRYSHLNVMWEELTDDKGDKRWHVGLVWE